MGRPERRRNTSTAFPGLQNPLPDGEGDAEGRKGPVGKRRVGLTGSQRVLARAAGVLVALTLTSRVAGFVREMALAHVFGATGSTDAYLVGLTLPVAFAALAGAALHTAFIPVLAEVAEKRGHAAASRLASNVINITFIIAIAIFMVGEVGAEPITRLVAPGLEGETFRRALDLTRYLLPMIVFQSLSWLLAGVLQTDGEFGLPALATVVYNLVLIFSIVVLGPRFGISAVGVGTVAAVIAQAGLQFAGLRRRGFRWLPVLDWRDPKLLKLGRLVVPVIIGAGAVELARVADKVIASHLWEGTISALSYATRLTASASSGPRLPPCSTRPWLGWQRPEKKSASSRPCQAAREYASLCWPQWPSGFSCSGNQS